MENIIKLVTGSTYYMCDLIFDTANAEELRNVIVDMGEEQFKQEYNKVVCDEKQFIDLVLNKMVHKDNPRLFDYTGDDLWEIPTVFICISCNCPN
jgi:hypothetical protein